MLVQKEEILKIARLASLVITEDSIEKYKNDISNILYLVNKINKVDTSNILPMTNPTDEMPLFMRKDIVQKNDISYLDLAKNVKDDFYIVPKIL